MLQQFLLVLLAGVRTRSEAPKIMCWLMTHTCSVFLLISTIMHDLNLIRCACQYFSKLFKYFRSPLMHLFSLAMRPILYIVTKVFLAGLSVFGALTINGITSVVLENKREGLGARKLWKIAPDSWHGCCRKGIEKF